MIKSYLALLVLASSTLLIGCSHEDPSLFGLEDSPIRYRQKQFEDSNILAEAAGLTFTKSQILDKSPVIKDLRSQESEMTVGLAYIRTVEKLEAAGRKPSGPIEIYLPEPKTSITNILNRFGMKPLVPVTYHQGSDSSLIARSTGVDVKKEELDLNHIAFQTLEQRMFREVGSELNAQISRILLAEKARQKNTDLASYIKSEIFGGEVKASKAEVDEYLREISVPEDQITDENREKFTDAVRVRKEQHLIEEYVARIVLKGPMEVSFGDSSLKMRLNDDWRPVAGFKDAPVSVIAFSAISCPDCATFVESISKIMTSYAGHLKLNWIHTYNARDGIAEMMATAAICIDAVKPGKTLDFMRAFARTGPQSDERQFADWAGHHGVDAQKFKACLTNEGTKELLKAHLDYAEKVGVVANPTLWIEGRMAAGVISDRKIEELVEDGIRLKNSSRFWAFVRRIKGWFS